MKPINLEEHPEGGHFRQVFKSEVVVRSDDGRTRSAITHIYFSLKKGEVSRFHRVSSDEVWNLYRGAGIRLYTWDETDKPPEVIELSAEKDQFCHVVPAGFWQAAEPLEEEVLVGCSVGPGFEFEDFELIDPGSESARMILSFNPELRIFISP